MGVWMGRPDRATLRWHGLLLASLLTAANGTRAQDAPQLTDAAGPPGYAEAIREAVDHYSAERWRPAQKAFARAHALQPSARTYRGLGLSAFYLDEFAAARAAFEQALADTRRPLPEEQKRALSELLLETTRLTGRIELQVEPSSARVELDGVVIESSVLFVDRGAHVLSVSAEGYVSQRTTLVIEGGEQRSLDLRLEAQASEPAAVVQPEQLAREPAPPAAQRAIAPVRQMTSPDEGGRVFTWIAAAAVPVFAGSAGLIWVTGQNELEAVEDDCQRDGCDAAEGARRLDAAGVDAHETWTNVCLVVSGVALATATVLFFVEGKPSTRSDVELTVERSGALLRGQF
jgi:hypothetical protein